MKKKSAKSASQPSIKPDNTITTTNAVQGLEEHYEPTRKGADKDPYSVQDRIYSKFACTMHYSVSGNIWHDFKLAKYCENCGDKTLICP